ncbi:MAG TPA: Gfo/Idh/MocA family oxidoreductase [Steroidobacteraceae bacterium]|nr:Gfo/Idh/MocA family oxidoreductase [Steroidobacteraceae bacterium]
MKGPDSKRDIRVALVGFGLGGSSFHAPLIAATPGMKLTTVVTSNEARASQARREHPGVQVAATTDWLWDHAADHDLAVVTTPNRVHAALALAALSARLPVVVDKPFARTASEARQVIQMARDEQLPVTPYHNRRWDSEFLTLRRLMGEGLLGRVLRFEARLERWRPELKGGWRERGQVEEAGGLLYDLGSHLIDQALALFGPVREVYAELDRRRAGAETDDDVFLALTHANGVRSHLWTSAMAAHRGPRMRVLGERAAFVKQHADRQEAALRSANRFIGPDWGEEPPEYWGILTDGAREEPVRSEPGAYQRFYAELAAMLRDGAPPPVAPEDALAGLEIIEAAQRSAAQHRVVTLGPQ